MKYISNSRYGQPVENGTIYKCKKGEVDITVHKLIGCGNDWYLSSTFCNIRERRLNNEGLIPAIKEAQNIIYAHLSKAIEDFREIAKTEIEVTR